MDLLCRQWACFAVARLCRCAAARSLVVFSLSVAFVLAGCGPTGDGGPESLTVGVWAQEVGQQTLLLQVSSAPDGGLGCVLHRLAGGRKTMETPCEEVEEAGDSIRFSLPGESDSPAG